MKDVTPLKPATAAVPASNLLHLDIDNMWIGQAGLPGLTPNEVTNLRPRLEDIHQAVVRGMDEGLGGTYACLNLHREIPKELPAIEKAAKALSQYRDIIVVGIGGSSLGSKAIQQALTAGRSHQLRPNLYFLENVDPYLIEDLFYKLQAKSTAVVAISKSGGTIETVVQYLIVREWLERHLGRAQAAAQQWVVTDPATGWLRELATSERIASLPVPPKVGGRYSVLSAVGLLPLAAVGIDAQGLLQGATANAARCVSPDPNQNPALLLAALYYLQDVRRGVRTSIMMPYVNPLKLFVDWYCQLWAESLGKKVETAAGPEPAGTLPVRAMGAVDQHSQLQMYLESRFDKMFTFLALEHWAHDRAIPVSAHDRAHFPYLENTCLSNVMDAEFKATREVISTTGHPNLTLTLPELSAHVLGQLIDLYQRVTVYAGLLYGVNPLDQPAVERGKLLAVERLTHR
jgi:glucose-6-phosphate isomerase